MQLPVLHTDNLNCIQEYTFVRNLPKYSRLSLTLKQCMSLQFDVESTTSISARQLVRFAETPKQNYAIFF